MSTTRALVLAAALLSFPAVAQTTGMPGFNDYTISGLGSGSTSCTLLTLVSGTHTFAISTIPGATVYVYVNSVPCSPSSIMGCQGSTIDLALSPFPLLALTTPVPTGTFSIPAFLPSGLFFSTQCISIFAGCPPWFSQAYDVQT